MKKVCHLSSVHSPLDPRIFYKECASLAKAGYDVSLVIPTDTSYEEEGVRVVAVQKPKGRLYRMVFTTLEVLRKGLTQKAHIYHFHDPELIPAGIVLRLLGKKVVYDIHEDYVTDLCQKPYIPKSIAPAFSTVFGWFESVVTQGFAQVLAERYYQERFPRGIQVCNYPFFKPIERTGEHSHDTISPVSSSNLQLLYTGNIGVDRGCYHHAKLLAHLPSSCSMMLVGRCSPEVAQKMRELSPNRTLIIEGEGHHVPYAQILEKYVRGGWLAGLAIFPETPHYTQKELTKFFEYMAAGLPIICSNFSRWKELIEECQVGICVDPENIEEQIKAVEYLRDNPEECRAMGERGKALVRDKFNWEVESKKLLKLYETLIS